MSKTRLLFELILYVNAKKVFTAQDIAHEFNISVRTAHRYLVDLSEMGIPLFTEQGRNGGYRILNNRVLPPITLDEDEAFAIFFAFQSLKYYRSLPFDVNIASASRKLYAIIPEDIKKKIDRLEFVLSFWNKKRSIPSPFLKDILEASLVKHVLIIEYMSKSKNKVKEVVPIGIYAHDGFWYMPALDIEQDAVRLIRVDRILSLKTSEVTHSVPLTLDEWLNNHTTRIPVRLYATLTREGLRQCRNEPWLEPHIILTDHENGYIDIEIDKSEIEFVSNYFFRLGTDATVIEPQEIINNIRERARSITAHYQ